MRKVAGLLALIVVALLVGCSVPADEPAKNWVTFLDKHKAAINAGTFDVEAFKKEGQPLVDELKKHRDPKEDAILMTQPVLDEWNRANKEFVEAAQAKLNLPALQAIEDMAKQLGAKSGDASNAPANS
jgi:hypothetical protein